MSVKASEKLKEIQSQLAIPEHKLIQEVETRWNHICSIVCDPLEKSVAWYIGL